MTLDNEANVGLRMLIKEFYEIRNGRLQKKKKEKR